MSNLEAYLQFVDLARLHRAKRLAREMKRPGEAQLDEMNGLSNESGGAAPVPRATGKIRRAMQDISRGKSAPGRRIKPKQIKTPESQYSPLLLSPDSPCMLEIILTPVQNAVIFLLSARPDGTRCVPRRDARC